MSVFRTSCAFSGVIVTCISYHHLICTNRILHTAILSHASTTSYKHHSESS